MKDQSPRARNEWEAGLVDQTRAAGSPLAPLRWWAAAGVLLHGLAGMPAVQAC